MKRAHVFFGVIGLTFITAALSAQEGQRKGTIKKTDAGKGIITITADGKDQDYLLLPESKVMDAATGQPVANPFQNKSMAAGTPVLFKAAAKDGKNVLWGIMLNADKQPPAKERPPSKMVLR
jgi:hypothetical protein